MRSVPASVVARIAAAIASTAAALTLLSWVISLSEPQHSQLIAATASRRAAPPESSVLVAQAKRAASTPIADSTAR